MLYQSVRLLINFVLYYDVGNLTNAHPIGNIVHLAHLKVDKTIIYQYQLIFHACIHVP